MVSEFGSTGYFNNLKQSVLDDRVGKPGRDICHGSPFLLSLFNFRVHKYRTAGSQIDRILGVERLVGKIFHCVVK